MRVIGKDGHEREEPDSYILKDGERCRFSGMSFYDAAPFVHDGLGGPAGRRPGYLFSNDHAAATAYEMAYQEYKTRVSDAWRKPAAEQPSTPAPANTGGAVVDAYTEYEARIRNAWRS